LTKGDCDLVEASGITTIAVNSSWQMARFADYNYAGDKGWWVKNGHLIDIDAIRIACDETTAIFHGTKTHRSNGAYNSGMMAIRYAIQKLHARRIVLLGYDCSVDNGVHWHGPHANLKNPTSESCKKWMPQFAKVASEAKAFKADIVNCSRMTALTCFRMSALEDVL
jgi:hypothetical protein